MKRNEKMDILKGATVVGAVMIILIIISIVYFSTTIDHSATTKNTTAEDSSQGNKEIIPEIDKEAEITEISGITEKPEISSETKNETVDNTLVVINKPNTAINVPDDNLTIVGTINRGTFTLSRDGKLELWKNKEVISSKRIPIPKEDQINDNMFDLNSNYYIDESNNLISLQTYETNGSLFMEINTIEKNIEKIYKQYQPSKTNYIVFQNCSGDYGVIIFTEDIYNNVFFKNFDNSKPFNSIKYNTYILSKDSVKNLHLSPLMTVKEGNMYLLSWELTFKFKKHEISAIIYTCTNEVEVSEEYLDNFTGDYTAAEFEEKYAELVAETQKYE